MDGTHGQDILSNDSSMLNDGVTVAGRQAPSSVKGDAEQKWRDRKSTWRLRTRAQLQQGSDPGNGIIIDTYSAGVCKCNEAAWTMLNVLEQGANLDKLVNALLSKYEVSRQVAEADILGFVQRLKRLEFVDEQ